MQPLKVINKADDMNSFNKSDFDSSYTISGKIITLSKSNFCKL